MDLSAAAGAAVAAALAEDVGEGDRTTESVVPASARCRAALVLEEPGVVCGVAVAASVFTTLDPDVSVEALVEEGTRCAAAQTVLARLEGPARALLTGERSALNLLGRLCGVATLTARYVELVEGTGATVLDTRKTTPGLRTLEKYAVRCGGGTNHRAGLHDAILIKENHLRIAGGIGAAVAALPPRNGIPVEVEAETLAEVGEALEAGVDRILLDNMTVEEVARAVELAAGRVPLEASGGITLATVRSYAETGVEFVSIGALTRSARSLDCSLDVSVAACGGGLAAASGGDLAATSGGGLMGGLAAAACGGDLAAACGGDLAATSGGGLMGGLAAAACGGGLMGGLAAAACGGGLMGGLAAAACGGGLMGGLAAAACGGGLMGGLAAADGATGEGASGGGVAGASGGGVAAGADRTDAAGGGAAVLPESRAEGAAGAGEGGPGQPPPAAAATGACPGAPEAR